MNFLKNNFFLFNNIKTWFTKTKIEAAMKNRVASHKIL